MSKQLKPAFVAGLLFILSGIHSLHAENLTVGQPAPALIVQTIDGKTFNLTALKGKVVMLHFWAPWCAPCKQEMPVMEAFYKKHQAKGFEIIALDVDPATSRAHDQAKEVLSKFSYPGALLRDATESTYDAPRIVPSTYVVDRDGIVRIIRVPDKIPETEHDLEEPMSEHDLEDLIFPLLKSDSKTH